MNLNTFNKLLGQHLAHLHDKLVFVLLKIKVELTQRVLKLEQCTVLPNVRLSGYGGISAKTA